MPRSNKKKSLVWKCFRKTSDEEAECLICHRVIKVVLSGTSSLRKHMIRLHPEESKLIFEGGDLGLVDNFVEEDASDPDYDMKTIPHVRGGDRRKSAVWNFFTLHKNQRQTTCNVCSHMFSYADKSTSNLRKHIKNKHPSLVDQLISGCYNPTMNLSFENVQEEDRKLAIGSEPKVKVSAPNNQIRLRKIAAASPYTPITTTNSTVRKKRILDDSIVEMLALDLQPVSVVESKGFRKFVTALNPNYIIPDRKVVTNELLPGLYQQKMNAVMKKLESVSHIALSTEMWSHDDREIYLSVTAHFISQSDWSLQSAMLSTTAFIGTPTGKEISCELQRMINEWNLSSKITVMVTDNDTNTLLANEQLPWAYVPCFGHLLHLVVTNAISSDEEASEIITKVDVVLNFFQHNHEARGSLATIQKELNLPENKLIHNVKSRWNSIYYMLERMLEQMDAVNAVLEMYFMSAKRLTDQDRDMINKVTASLKAFEVASLSLNSDESRSISVAMPLVKGLVKMVTSLEGGKEPLTGNLKEGLISSFGKMEEIEWITTATLLDPRFKKFPFANAEAIEKAKENIMTELSEIIEPKHVIADASSKSTTTNTNKPTFWNYFDEVTNNSDVQEREISSVSSREVKCYLDSSAIPRADNPLFYWSQHQELLPNLYKIAMKYMSVPITAVPAERLFTKAGEVHIQKTSKMKPKNINMLLFLNRNM